MMQLEHSKLHSLANPNLKSRNTAKSAGRWTKEEHQRFIQGIKKFGKNWKLVEDYVATRSGAQIRSHAQKFFNRLERDFNLKFDDLNTQATKEKFNETLMKMADYHDDEGHVKSQKPRKNSEKTVCGSPDSATDMSSKFMSMSSSPKVDHLEIETVKRDLTATRKISEEMKNHSFFDIIMSKIMSSNNTITTPKLSDFLDLSSSSTRASFDTTHIEPSSSFKLHSKNISEGNLMKLNQLRRPDDNLFNDAELMGKKLKTN